MNGQLGQAAVVAECSKCGAKFTSAGTTLGGSDSCTPHSFGPVGGFKKNIVYPTDAERAWLSVLDNNKEENAVHLQKFETDMEQLATLKDTALQEINAKVETLRTLLGERERALEQQVEQAFSDRLQSMQSNVDSLNEHRGQNEEAKSQSEDALLTNTNQTERETKIVNDCKQIVSSTPQIRFIPTELRMTFSLLASIEQKVQAFGKLNTKAIDSGGKCQFPSMSGPKNAAMFGPKIIDLDGILEVVPGVATFVDNAQKLRLSFALKIKDKAAVDEIMNGVCIRVDCHNDDDDAKENDGHTETVKLRQCSKQQNGSYFVNVNKRFARGITVRWTLKPMFVSPDAEKFADAEGSESPQQTYDIKEELFRFLCALNGQKQTLELSAADEALHDYEAFKRKFLVHFEIALQDDELLFLSTKDGALTEDAALTQFATPQYTITGEIQSTKGGAEGNPGAMNEGLEAPKKITMFASCDGKKKRILLRKKDNQINIASLRSQIVSKLFKSDPNQKFSLRAYDEALETDEQLISVYSEPDQEVTVEKM